MNTELSSILEQDGRLTQWAEAVVFNGVNLSAEDKDISAAMDAFLKEGVGKTGADPNHEIAQLIRKAITPDVVAAPTELIDMLFEPTGNVGEFDDVTYEIEPENTIRVYESVPGGNVNRSYIDHKNMTPQWKSLQAETEISLADIRRGGYRTVANAVQNIRNAFDQKKVALLLSAMDGVVISGGANYINETGSAPTEASMDKLAIYLLDVATTDNLVAFGQNRYIQPVAAFEKTTKYLTDTDKTWYNQHGLNALYSGVKLMGYSGTKKLADGSLIVPNGVVFGAAGPVGKMCTRGDTIVLQETDINSEKIHIKVNGYTFGYAITAPKKIGKIVIAG